MIAYRKERIENAILFFAKEHYKKTKNYISQTALYKYLAFFEFRHLAKYGEMPLELQYKAMEQGPVPIEIYSKRDDAQGFSLVKFEPTQIQSGVTIYIIKPIGKFNADYFSENELEEMKNLTEIFAQQWVTASVMSDASHRDIRAWAKTYKTSPNAMINPIDNFIRDIEMVASNELKPEEERFLMHQKLADYIAKNTQMVTA
ncbi:hypothetical protein FACS1894102_7390 [Spirochaetia bacterium]|nr:hypothetical protein FACS1894102_7390 [Spirochaetia bacterium]